LDNYCTERLQIAWRIQYYPARCICTESEGESGRELDLSGVGDLIFESVRILYALYNADASCI